MKDFLEIEYKSLLSETEFGKLKKQFSEFPPILQTNTYFDSEDRSLYQQHISLRIRQMNGEFVLTIKHPYGEHVQEYNAEIADSKLSTLVSHPYIEKYINPYISREIGVLGTLSTSRISIPFRQGVLCLDQNMYLNKIDYELEYELNENCTDDYEGFLFFLAQYEIDEKKAKGKFFRFIQALDNDIECERLP